ncbi:MAG: InlB B-repeat-containing protein [Clostridiales bacterium]|nr:InlB B-repeat-containing protein [Clostridiales bacterium]
MKTAWNFNTAVTTNITLYAKWNVQSYALKYVYGNGTAESSSQVEYNKAITLAAAPTRTGYTFSGWNDGTTTRAAGASYTMPAKAVTMTAVWARVNGLFNGENLVQAFVVSDTGKEYAAKCFKVTAACTLTVYVDNKVGTVTNIKSGSDSNVTYSNGLKFNKAGVYTVYYRYVKATSGDVTGIYVVRHGEVSDYLTPNIQSTDGVYVGNTKVGTFVFNENNMNQVMATNVTITAANNTSAVDVTFKYGGQAVTLTQIDLDDGITNAGTTTTVKLYNGTYSFYYNFGKNSDGIKGRIWIEGTQTGAPAVKSGLYVNDQFVLALSDNGYDRLKAVGVTLKVNDILTFYTPYGNTQITDYFTVRSGCSGNGKVSVVGNTLKVTTAGTFDFYYCKDGSDENGFWVEYEEIGACTIKGSFDGWGAGLAMTRVLGTTNEYTVTYKFTAAAEIKYVYKGSWQDGGNRSVTAGNHTIVYKGGNLYLDGSATAM